MPPECSGSGGFKTKLSILGHQADHLAKNRKGVEETVPGTFRECPGVTAMQVDEMVNFIALANAGGSDNREENKGTMLSTMEGKAANIEYSSYKINIERVMVSEAKLPTLPISSTDTCW